jgi:hypothetical protein
MAQRLVVVEEAFVARGRGVLVDPRFTVTDPPSGTFRVRLRLPDGTERETTASLEVSHVRGSLPPYAMIRLLELGVNDVPPGTEVWTLDGPGG